MAGEGLVELIKSKDDFDNKKKTETRLIVVDFYADWCGPCRMISPKIEEMAKQMQDVCFVKINVDDCEEVAEECGISAMPTFKLFKNNAEVAEVVGASEAKIKEAIEKNK